MSAFVFVTMITGLIQMKLYESKYNNWLIAKLINIFPDVKDRMNRRELGSHASNNLGMKTYEVVDSDRIIPITMKRKDNRRHVVI